MIKIPDRNGLKTPGHFFGKKWVKTALMFLGIILSGAILVYSCSTPRQTAPLSEGQEHGQAQFSVFDLGIRVILSLVIISALIYMTVYALRFIQKKRQNAGTAAPNHHALMQIMESMNLDASRKIHLVKVGKKILVVGSSENQVSLIAEIEEDDIEKGLQQKEEPVQAGLQENNFKTIFSNYFKNMRL